MNDLKQYTILITGAASGNGFGIAKFCTDYFSKLILVDKDKAGLEKAKNDFYKNNIPPHMGHGGCIGLCIIAVLHR